MPSILRHVLFFSSFLWVLGFSSSSFEWVFGDMDWVSLVLCFSFLGSCTHSREGIHEGDSMARGGGRYISSTCLPVHPARKPLLELVERLAAVRDLVLLALLHLGIRLALVLKARVPPWSLCQRPPPCTVPDRMNQDLPNTVGPRLATSFPSVLPWNRTGSWPGPSQ